MGKKDLATRYYEKLDMIERSERKFNETTPAFLMSVKHNLYVSDLKRQCRRPRNGSDGKNRRT